MSELNRQKNEYIQHAMSEMSDLYWMLSEAHDEKMMKRVDAIMGKMFELQYVDVNEEE